ncbi:MAG: FAD-dependent oxidoreductase [Planctomycetota bacterium]
MLEPSTPSPGLAYYYPIADPPAAEALHADVVVYGGTAAGVAAAIQATRSGRSALLMIFGRHVGGMTSGGLGHTDIGNKAAIGGISREFYRRVGEHYGQDEAWQFEPHVAEAVLCDMLEEAGVEVRFEQRLTGVEMDGSRLVALQMEYGNTARGRMFIDATYDGDLLAMAGVSYTVGREPNTQYRETLNGIHFGHPAHNFKNWIDPYVEPGRPDSGLLPGVQDLPLGHNGQGDRCLQAFNFRVCLTHEPDNQRPFPEPANYDPLRYELLIRYIHSGVWDALRLSNLMPRGKTDTNNFGGFSSDHIGGNYDWPEADYARREAIFQDHVSYNQGLYHFLVTDSRVPESIRQEVEAWGLPLDEFVETGNWPHELYVREARRMVSDLVMTEHHCRRTVDVDDPIGLAAYTMDSHNCRRLVVDGRAYNEGNVEVPPSGPYPIGYRALVPKAGECENLLVPWCLSSTHIAFGSIRMEPVGMVLGQSAATAAALAIEQDTAVQEVDYPTLRRHLQRDGQVLNWPEPPATTCLTRLLNDASQATSSQLAMTDA